MSTATDMQSGSRVGHRLAKAPTGIRGFDKITDGGLPLGRPTLASGASGAGKTPFEIEFLVRGAREFGEPGVLMTFEERASDVSRTWLRWGSTWNSWRRTACWWSTRSIDSGRGAFDLDGLFIRLAAAVEEVGARRVVRDTIEVLFGALGNEAIVRGELGRLFRPHADVRMLLWVRTRTIDDKFTLCSVVVDGDVSVLGAVYARLEVLDG